jgi:hypothetical protein
MRLFAPLRRLFAPDDLGELRAELAALRAAVRELDAVQLRRELEAAEVAEKLKRYLQRISAVDQRARQREEGSTEADPVTAAVLRIKYSPKQNQQGG